MFNLRNRSFLKEIDFEPRELRFLLQLSEAVKIAKYAGTEAKRLDGKEIALIFEKTSTRTRSAFEVAAFDQGAHVTYLDPSGSQLGHKESVADTARVLGPDVRRHRVPRQRAGRRRGAGGERRRARLQRPHQRVAPDPDAGRLPDDARGERQALRRPVVRVRRRLPVQHGSVAAGDGGADGRRRAPRRAGDAGAARRRRRRSPGTSPPAPVPRSRSPRTSPRPSPGWTSCTPTCGCRWASRRTCGTERVGLLDAVPGERRAAGEDRQPEGEVHALPAGVPRPEHGRRPGDDGAHRHEARASR